MSRRNPEVWFWQAGMDLPSNVVPGFGRRRKAGSGGFWEPKVDLLEGKDHFSLRVELAGVPSEDVQLIYLPDSHSILIRGVRREEDGFDGSRTGAHQLEVYYGEFEREVELPDFPIEPGQIRAHFKNGFLYVLAPKAKASFQHVKVSIRKV